MSRCGAVVARVPSGTVSSIDVSDWRPSGLSPFRSALGARLIEEAVETTRSEAPRQVATVTRVMPSRFAIARLLTPSAASSTI